MNDRRASYGEALASSEFRALLASQLLNVAGTSVAAVALTVLVYRQTHSPLLASMTFALSFVPYLFAGSLLSSVVDLFRPRILISVGTALSGLVSGAIALPRVPVAVLFVLLFASGAIAALSSGARAALTRATTSELGYVPGRSLLRIAAQVAQLGGNAGGGALLLLISPRSALLLNAALSVAAAVIVRFGIQDHPNEAEPSERPLLRSSLRGARIILGHRELRRLLLFNWLDATFLVFAEAVAAPYVASHHGSASLVGWWLVALPIGLISGDIAGVRLLSARQQRRVMAPAAAFGFLPYLVFAWNPSIALAIPLLVITGLSGLSMLGLDGRMRDITPPHLFARAMTVNQSGLMALQGIGFALGGAVAQVIGPAGAIAVAGTCGLSCTVVLMRSEVAGRAPVIETPAQVGAP